MSLSQQQIKHLAHLSRLKLTKQEAEKFSGEIDKILQYVGQLAEVKTDKVVATSQVTGLDNVVREDVIKIDSSQKEILSCAPAVEKNQVKVKSIFGEAR